MLLIEVYDLQAQIGEKVLFKLPHTKVYRGDRIGIIGKNGAGKTCNSK
ncbi:hypothetical protein [Ectobacillus panaciterrae]|nr:hypothetical protein [Ectobacillus panaciterrae]